MEDVQMVALQEGTKAPVFELTGVDGSKYSLTETLQSRPLVVLAFFKVSCPVCQLIAPYWERLHQSHPDVPIWGISQDDAEATKAFASMFGCTFPMLLDKQLSATVDYDLTNVPTVFVVQPDLTISHTIVGFIKNELVRLHQTLSETHGGTGSPLFTPADDVPELKPG
jgi:peroxiredoxin